ncbi:MAG: hypothetical protein KM310_00355 [Clostridiales bacterium]|nr:hypothetical protein [Clostridiales bacterium]
MSVTRYPSAEALADAVAQELQKVQAKARARLISPDETRELLLDAIPEHSSGYFVQEGGRVSNSYRYPADTSRVEVFWLRKRGAIYALVSVKRWPVASVRHGKAPFYDALPLDLADNPIVGFELLSQAFENPERAEKLLAYITYRRVRETLRRKWGSVPSIPFHPQGYYHIVSLRTRPKIACVDVTALRPGKSHNSRLPYYLWVWTDGTQPSLNRPDIRPGEAVASAFVKSFGLPEGSPVPSSLKDLFERYPRLAFEAFYAR